MVRITTGQLVAIMPHAPDPIAWSQVLTSAMSEFWISSPAAAAAFLAQVAHESGELKHVVERLSYSAAGLRKTWPSRFRDDETARIYERRPQAIAERVYGDRMGNGPEGSGDGWKFRGRGLLQVTGRANYLEVGRRLGLDLEARPELLEQPLHAARSAASFWSQRALSALAERGEFDAITRRINGGLNGAADRRAYWARAKQALGASSPSKGAGA